VAEHHNDSIYKTTFLMVYVSGLHSAFFQAGFYWTGSDSIIRSLIVIIDVVPQNNKYYCYFIKLYWEIMDIRCHYRSRK
jgi:hypothetical protein